MSSNFVSVGMNGVVQVNSVAVANLKNANFSIRNDNVEEYVCGGTNPNRPGLWRRRISMRKSQRSSWTDNTNLALPQTPTSMTMIIGPKGPTSGDPKYTFSDVVISQLDLEWDQKSANSDSFTAKASYRDGRGHSAARQHRRAYPSQFLHFSLAVL